LIRTSTDRTNWFFRNTPLSNGGTLYGLEFGDGEFVAVGEGLVGAGGILERSPLLFSGGSTNWYSRNSGSFSTIWDIAFGQGVYVMAGSFGLQSSTNGIDWTSRASGLSSQLAGISHVNGMFILTAWSGGLSTSPDGINWTKRTNSSTRTLMEATYGNGLYVVVGRTPGGSSGSVLTSSDAATWTNRSAANLNAICFAKDLFVTVGDAGLIRTSTNAVNWTTRTSGTTASLWGVTWGDGYFVTVGDQGLLLTSTDGATWTRRNAFTSQSLQDVVYARGTFVVVGGGSTILQSAPTIPFLELRSLSGPTRFELNLKGGFDRAYAIETCLNPGAGGWSNVTTLPQGQRQFVDLDPLSSRRFYRVTAPQ
jgi:hypothetical protein